MADVKWIKIAVDIFDDEKILLIEQMPEGYALITVWFKLLCLAGKQNNSGVFIIYDKIPYTDEMLSKIFRMKLDIVRLALTTFQGFGMVDIINNTLTIPKWGKHQSLDRMEKQKEYMRTYMADYRDKQKSIAEGKKTACKLYGKTNGNTNSKGNVKRTELELDKELYREDKERESKQVRHQYGQYENVLLNDADYLKLKSEFPDYQARIERLSEYIASKGVSYKNHLATIRSWAKKDKTGGKPISAKDNVNKVYESDENGWG